MNETILQFLKNLFGLTGEQVTQVENHKIANLLAEAPALTGATDSIRDGSLNIAMWWISVRDKEMFAINIDDVNFGRARVMQISGCCGYEKKAYITDLLFLAEMSAKQRAHLKYPENPVFNPFKIGAWNPEGLAALEAKLYEERGNVNDDDWLGRVDDILSPTEAAAADWWDLS